MKLLQISLELHEHRGRYWRKKLPWAILEEQFLVPRFTAASKIGNSVRHFVAMTTPMSLQPWPQQIFIFIEYNCGGSYYKSLFRAT